MIVKRAFIWMVLVESLIIFFLGGRVQKRLRALIAIESTWQ